MSIRDVEVKVESLEKMVDLLQSIICLKVCIGNSEVLNAKLKKLMDDEGLYGEWPEEDDEGSLEKRVKELENTLGRGKRES